MKKGSSLFLKVIILLIGVGALAVLLWYPWIEGRNANSDAISVYFKDPFLAYVYIASIPFFTALYQAFKLLGFIAENKVFSQISVKALRRIKYCAVIIVGFIAGAEAYIITGGDEDSAGAVMVGLLMAFIAVVIAAAAAVFERLLQNAIDIKSENDLTV